MRIEYIELFKDEEDSYEGLMVLETDHIEFSNGKAYFKCGKEECIVPMDAIIFIHDYK